MPEKEAFTADMKAVFSTLSSIPRGSATVEQYAAASKAFAGAVERHTANGFLSEDRDSALTLFYSGYSLMARLDDVRDIPAEIYEEAWESYEGLASLLGIDLVLLHGGDENSGEQSMTAQSQYYFNAVAEVGTEVRAALANLVDQEKPLEGLITDWEELSHNSGLQKMVFVCYEIRVAYSAYVACLMEECVKAGQADRADEILAIYSRSGTGYFLPIKKFWRN